MHLETTVRQPAAARLPFGRAPATCSLLQTVKPWFCGSLMSVLDQLATGPNLSIFSEKRVSYSLLGSETEKKNKGKKKKKYSGKIEWCRLVLFVQKKKASAICSVWQRVAVCSFYLSFSVLTENPDAQNGHNNHSAWLPTKTENRLNATTTMPSPSASASVLQWRWRQKDDNITQDGFFNIKIRRILLVYRAQPCGYSKLSIT